MPVRPEGPSSSPMGCGGCGGKHHHVSISFRPFSSVSSLLVYGCFAVETAHGIFQIVSIPSNLVQPLGVAQRKYLRPCLNTLQKLQAVHDVHYRPMKLCSSRPCSSCAGFTHTEHSYLPSSCASSTCQTCHPESESMISHRAAQVPPAMRGAENEMLLCPNQCPAVLRTTQIILP